MVHKTNYSIFALYSLRKHAIESKKRMSNLERKGDYKMKEQEKIIREYTDPIEERQIRHFACKEMGRQIHRYIKAMKGSKAHMLRFEEALEALSLEEKEKAIARYLDLNRKALNGLDMKVVLARSMANYCDTFEYLIMLINDEQKMEKYLKILEDTYIQFHKVIEENGKFGIIDHHGKTILKPEYEFLRTSYVYVDDLRTMPIMAQKNGKMGLVLPDYKETVVAPFKYDSISLREQPPFYEAKIGDKEILLTTDGIEKSKKDIY